jgi:hypothetical protein
MTLFFERGQYKHNNALVATTGALGTHVKNRLYLLHFYSHLTDVLNYFKKTFVYVVIQFNSSLSQVIL